MSSRLLVASCIVLLGIAVVGCGSSGDKSGSGDDTPQPVAKASDFPSTKGTTMLGIRNKLGGGGPVVAPTVEQLDPGSQRYGFALFTLDRKQVSGAPVALYVQRQGTAKTYGPFVARDMALRVAPPFQSETVAKDPDAAKSLYVTHLRFPKPGSYAVMAVSKESGKLVASDPIGARVLAKDPVPNVGDKAPVIDTPTVKSAGGNVQSIDTRQPPDDMHEVNFKDAVGKKPIVLVFATPALCQSRVCGPVVDIAEEVKSESKGQADFIHMEIYRNNTIANGCLEGTRPAPMCLRPQVTAFHLLTEPWAFAIDRKGRIAARLEGAYSKSELQGALRAALQG